NDRVCGGEHRHQRSEKAAAEGASEIAPAAVLEAQERIGHGAAVGEGGARSREREGIGRAARARRGGEWQGAAGTGLGERQEGRLAGGTEAAVGRDEEVAGGAASGPEQLSGEGQWIEHGPLSAAGGRG